MFTGIVLERGLVVRAEKDSRGIYVLAVRSQLPEAAAWALGDSVAINGLCLTITENKKEDTSRVLTFEVSSESLSRSNLAFLKSGDFVHLESALAMGAPLGGHLVSGHVDALAEVKEVQINGEFWNVIISLKGDARERVAPFVVEKGSIAVDGVSLTINTVCDMRDESTFSFVLIPHTLERTHFSQLKVGAFVNLEADLLAKYVLRYKNFKEYSQEAGQ